MASSACYTDRFNFLYVGDVRASQETRASTACYSYNFPFLPIDDVRASQDTHLSVSTACYGDSFTLSLYFAD
jgi:hypothetical protein